MLPVTNYFFWMICDIGRTLSETSLGEIRNINLFQKTSISLHLGILAMASETLAFLRLLFCFPSPMFCAQHRMLLKACLLLILFMIMMLNVFILQVREVFLKKSRIWETLIL